MTSHSSGSSGSWRESKHGGVAMKRRVAVCIACAVAVLLGACVSAASALVPDGSHGWFWQMPQPGAGLSDVSFVDAANLWAVGGDGLVLHSTDAGGTWTPQPAGSDADLWSVSFVDALHGWVAGGQPTTASPGVILATADGGGTWQDKTPAGLTESLTNASFVDTSRGWVGTTDGGLLKTTNGGTSWQHLKVGTYKGSVAVDFVNATHGWVGGTGGHIWSTANGGKTWSGEWTGMTPDAQVIQIDFVDRQHGWALAWSEWVGSEVVTTSDGGLFWRPVSTGYQLTTGLHAASPSSVWLVGFTFDFAGLTTPASLRHTSDGGMHWRSWTLATPAAPYAVSSNGDDVCAVGDGILASADAGASWKTTSSGQEYWFTGAAAPAADDIWAVEAGGALLHSTDGVRWAEQDYPARYASAFYAMSFADKQNGWAVGTPSFWSMASGGGVIVHTGDGGATWTPQASVLAGELVGVDFVDDNHGWAISDMPFGDFTQAPLTVEHTADGGVTWIPEFVPSNAPLTAVDFLNTTTGWVAARYVSSSSNAAIYFSTNSGLSWKKEMLPAGAPLITGLQFLDANSGWAVGLTYDNNDNPKEGWVLHTTNGGKSWTRVAGLQDTFATTVHFADPLDGWVGGLNGVYATTDGGVTWERVAGGYGVEAIAGIDSSHAWAFGDNFLVSTCDAAGDTAAPATLDAHLTSDFARTPVTVTLSPNDTGGSGVAGTEYSIDGGAWQSGDSITIAAPATHANDGAHTILYRSTDAAGNREQTEMRMVGIDTLGPACTAPRLSIVNTGKSGILYFKASDAWSGVKTATITLINTHRKVVARYVEQAGDWAEDPVPPFFWFRFACKLKPGRYRIEVRAVDWAGNAQCTVGRNWLRVVRSGAPEQYVPDWDSGLPDYTGFGPRFDHGPMAPWARGPHVGAAAVHGSHVRVWRYSS
jgi:photosystem II stability/assembly factor-like uncharacterized protein